MEERIIRLRDSEVGDLMGKKDGEEFDLTIKVKFRGWGDQEDYSTVAPVAPEEQSEGKDKKPKKYIEYKLEVQKAKEEKDEKEDEFFGEDKRTGKFATK